MTLPLEHIATTLVERGEWLALAESCTGGLIAKQVTDLAGSSRWFECGLVTYSNRAKQALLGVPAAVLDQHGAVSETCVRAMADGLRRVSRADWNLAVTGIAGPGGGSADKPVGTVWIAWRYRDQTALVERFLFAGDREQVRQQTAQAALDRLRQQLQST